MIDRSSNEFKACMKACRHLNASRAAWVANALTSGVQWRGCSKGHIVAGLLGGDYRRSPIAVERIVYAFRAQADSKGHLALTEAERERAERELASEQARAARLERQAKRYRERHGRPNYGFENPLMFANRRIAELEDGLEALAKKS